MAGLPSGGGPHWGVHSPMGGESQLDSLPLPHWGGVPTGSLRTLPSAGVPTGWGACTQAYYRASRVLLSA